MLDTLEVTRVSLQWITKVFFPLLVTSSFVIFVVCPILLEKIAPKNWQPLKNQTIGHLIMKITYFTSEFNLIQLNFCFDFNECIWLTVLKPNSLILTVIESNQNADAATYDVSVQRYTNPGHVPTDTAVSNGKLLVKWNSMSSSITFNRRLHFSESTTTNCLDKLHRYWRLINDQTKSSLQSIKQDLIQNGLLFDEEFKSDFLRSTYTRYLKKTNNFVSFISSRSFV